MIELYTTYKDAKGRLWVIVKFYYAELTDELPCSLTLYRVQSNAELQHVSISEMVQFIATKAMVRV